MTKLPRSLDAIEARVLGSLLEKAQTTPDYYPMTLKALVAACNQKSNRDPVMDLDEDDVLRTLERLKRDVMVWRTPGARAERWSESITRRLELSDAQRALIAVLLLRGPQTTGELRTRTERLHSFADLAAVESALEALTTGAEPILVELPRQPGHKFARWMHRLGDPEALEALIKAEPVSVSTPAPPLEKRTPLTPRVESLEQQVETLQQQVEALQRELSELKEQLGA
ncbi:MAG: DUF480 domain-containing protein [Acidobacteriota bacterium]